MPTAKEKKMAMALIGAIVAATASEVGFMFISQKNADILAAEGLVEVNPGLIEEGTGNVGARATQKAADMVASGAPVSTSTPSFEIEEGVEPPPAAKRGGGRGGATIYPFDKLGVNQSFFVPATADKPEPAKTLASTVSAANARYATPVFEADGTTPKMKTIADRTKGAVAGATKQVQEKTLTRQFRIAEGEKDGVKGARIWRIK